MPKMDLLQVIMKRNKYDKVGINESWLDMNKLNFPAEINFEGFRTFNVDKPSSSKRGGGSVLYVNESRSPMLHKNTATTTHEIIHVDNMRS